MVEDEPLVNLKRDRPQKKIVCITMKFSWIYKKHNEKKRNYTLRTGS